MAEPEMSDAARVEVLQRLNEVQHKLLYQLLHLLEGDSRRYPDDVFCAIVEEWTGDAPVVGEGLRWAITRAASALGQDE